MSSHRNTACTPIHGVNQNEEDGEGVEGGEGREEGDDSDLDYIPWLSYSFPFAPNVTHVSHRLRDEIFGSMPDEREAEELASFYFQCAAWM